MRFYTEIECKEWLSGRNRTKPNAADIPAALSLPYPEKQALRYWAYWIATSLANEDECLLWITGWGIFSSCENLHLYYRLRQSYHDMRLLHEAPGHLFLKYETEDLATFLQVAMQNFWDGYVLTASDYASAYFSHDEYIDFYTDQASLIDEVKKNLSDGAATEK